MTTTLNVTSIKNSTLQNLVRQSNDAATIAAKAESAYNSYMNKAQLFQNLLTTATSDQSTAKAQWASFITLKSSLKALEQTSGDSNLVAEITYNNISGLVKKWERVVQKSIEAADAVNLASDFINSRKAANIKISSELVTDATTIKKGADAAVTLVINALTASLNTLTASNQAKNSTELTGSYIAMASSALLKWTANPRLLMVLAAPEAAHEPLEISLHRILQNANDRVIATQAAVDNAKIEVASAKEAMDTAKAKVVKAQESLAAAQAAINA